MIILSLVVGFGYFLLTAMAWSFHPEKKYYHRILERPVLYYHMLFVIVMATFGYYRCRYINFAEAYFFTPLLSLSVLLIANAVARHFLNRNILIITKWDNKPRIYKWYIDGTLSAVLIITTFMAPVFIGIYFHNNYFYSTPQPTKITTAPPPPIQ